MLGSDQSVIGSISGVTRYSELTASKFSHVTRRDDQGGDPDTTSSVLKNIKVLNTEELGRGKQCKIANIKAYMQNRSTMLQYE